MLSIIIPSRCEPKIGEVYRLCANYFPDSEIIISTDLMAKGKGWAIRRGLRKAKGNIIATVDGDMDINPFFIIQLKRMLDEGYDVVVGKKDLWSLPFKRKILSFCSVMTVRILFNLGDTQTGVKIYKREFIPDFKTDGFAYDVEILAYAKKKGAKIGYYPIPINSTKGKRLPVILKTLWDIIKIRLSV